MNNKEIYNLVIGGAKPLVTLLREIDATIWDKGMRGRIISASLEDEGTEYECINFEIKEDEFREVNKSFMLHNYYDNKGVPCLNYIEAGYTLNSGSVSTFVMNGDIDFKIENENSILSTFLKETKDLKIKPNYVNWLENKLNKRFTLIEKK